jgi:PII-like signaling protein
VERRPAYAFAVDALRRHGVAGATVLLGVDGLLHRDRKRARLLSRNADVPLAVLSVGTSASISTALEELVPRLDDPLAVLELVRVCKRDGRLLEEPPVPAREDAAGLGVWQKLTVVAAEHARHGRHPLYVELIHRLRLAGAAGATAVRGIWGYSGDHAPHGDSLTALRRRVPVVLTVIDRPDRMGAWWPLVDEVTSEHGLVTSELVPAFRAVGPGIEAGGLRLARPAG